MTSDSMSPADIAAVTGNRMNSGFGYDGGGLWWIIILFLFGMFNGGWGNNGVGGNGMNGLYPWLNQSNQMNDGFQNQMLNTSIQGIQNGITSGFGDIQTALCGGFAGVNASITNAQMADMQQAFAMQSAMNQGFNGLQSQFAQCCCDNRLASCQTQNIIQNEGNATRFADANNTRDIIDAVNNKVQGIFDKLCQLELDGVKSQVEAKNDRIAELTTQLNMANLAASQVRQTADIQNNIVSELRSCPIPSQPVYGNQPIFTCNGNQGGCGCNGNSFYN